jgi:hypothetical protein
MGVSSKEIKKGTKVILRNGWKATIEDNKTTSHTRMATVQGDFTEMGSVYSTDIVEAMFDGLWFIVEHTPAQLKAAQMRKGWGF